MNDVSQWDDEERGIDDFCPYCGAQLWYDQESGEIYCPNLSCGRFVEQQAIL